jgi:thioredoxin reductase
VRPGHLAPEQRADVRERRELADEIARHAAHGLDVHIVGAGNSAGQAALFFSTHVRSVTILCRGDALEQRLTREGLDDAAAADLMADLVAAAGGA